MDAFRVASAGLASIPEDRSAANIKGVAYARQTKPGATVRRLRLPYEIDRYRAEHVGPGFAIVCLPTMQQE
jgi:hypothetical protein